MTKLLDDYVDQSERDGMFDHYVTTALWLSTDNATEQGGEPPDENYGVDDIAPETLAKMWADCMAFYDANINDITDGEFDYPSEKVVHDFWLTRNGHGCGFWDGDWSEDAGKRLTDSANGFGTFDLYIGDDGKIHGS
jgi:hypothetical protein